MAGAATASVGRDRLERLLCRLEQHGVDGGFVVIGDGCDRGRQSEHDVEVRDIEQIGLPRGQPVACRRSQALGAMPVATTIVGVARMGAVLAALDMAAEHGCATRFDGSHDAQLGVAQMPGIGTAVRLAVAAEDVRHLQLRAGWRHVTRDPDSA